MHIRMRRKLKHTILFLYTVALVVPVYAQPTKNDLGIAKNQEKGVKVDTNLDAAIKEWKDMKNTVTKLNEDFASKSIDQKTISTKYTVNENGRNLS